MVEKKYHSNYYHKVVIEVLVVEKNYHSKKYHKTCQILRLPDNVRFFVSGNPRELLSE